ncbi:hypothetical protein K501DRAFT_282016 [Backusella circina FSU 941]|nr:hypothetical protein K501DRAFT_282016 [Backusella circina FSU 941]
MTLTISEFEAKGWFLTDQGLELLKSKVDDDTASFDNYIEHAKDMDLRLLSTKGFPKMAENINEIPNNVVLQVLEITNVAMPSVHQVENPRWLRIVFTDGKRKYKAIEMKKLDCISDETHPYS